MAAHLTRLQTQLQSIYDVVIPYDVAHFVTTDAHVARTLDTSVNPREISEKLLLHLDDGNLDVALYLDSQLVNTLQMDDPTARLSESNLISFWTALEGVSHFLYLLWNINYGRPVSLFELELQAEIDKFVCAAALLTQQTPVCPLDALHARLFSAVQFDPALTPSELHRYRLANSLAARYCGQLARSFASTANSRFITHDLRRLYRLPHQRKVEHILRYT